MALTDITTYEGLIDFINTVGEDKIVGFILNNSARKLFTVDDKFSIAKNITDTGHLVFTEKDTGGITYYVHKPIITIETILTVDDPADIGKLNMRYMGG